MNGKRFGMRYVVLLVVLCGFTLALGVHSANAAPTRWSRWWTETSFTNNAIDTQLVIQLGYTNQAGQHFVTKQQSFTVNCTAEGTSGPLIQNGTATFDGSNYFSCDLPNIKQLVLAMSGGSLLIADASDAKRPALTATVAIDGAPNNLGSENPLFYRDDIQFSLPLDVVTQEARLVTSFDSHEAISDDFVITGAGQVVTAVYAKTNPNTFAPTFTVDTLSLPSTPPTLNGPFMLSNLDSTIYIGYSPVSGKFFEGTLTELVVDPVALGEG